MLFSFFSFFIFSFFFFHFFSLLFVRLTPRFASLFAHSRALRQRRSQQRQRYSRRIARACAPEPGQRHDLDNHVEDPRCAVRRDRDDRMGGSHRCNGLRVRNGALRSRTGGVLARDAFMFVCFFFLLFFPLPPYSSTPRSRWYANDRAVRILGYRGREWGANGVLRG